MKYALVATVEQELTYFKYDVEQNSASLTTETVPIGTILNTIMYDGVSPYVPLDGMELMEIADDKNIGDLA